MRKLLLALLLLPLHAFASVTMTVDVSTVLPTPPAGAYVNVALVNCPSASVYNSNTILPQSYKFYLNGQTSITFTIPDNVVQTACSTPDVPNSATNFLSYYTFSVVSTSGTVLLKSVELPAGAFFLANLANVASAPIQPGVLVGPQGPPGIPACATGVLCVLPANPNAVYQFTEMSGSTLADATGHGYNIIVPISSPPTLMGTGIFMSPSSTALTTPFVGMYSSAQVCFTAPAGAVQSSGISYDFPPFGMLLGNANLIGSSALMSFAQTATRQFMGPVTPTATYFPSGTPTLQVTTDAGVAGGVHCFLHVRGTSTDSLYIDGNLTSTIANTGTASLTTPTSAITIGGTTDVNSGNYKWWGAINSVAIWMTTALTQSQAVQSYNWAAQDIAFKGLLPNAPVSHPQDGIPRLIVIGDSVTQCAGIGGPSNAHCYWTQWKTSGLRPVLDTMLAANVTATFDPGGTSYGTSVLGSVREDTLYDPNASGNVATMFFGINDLCRNQYSGLQLYQRLAISSRRLRSRGVKTIVFTITDMINASACGINNESGSAAHNEANAIIRNQWQQDFDGIADIAGITNMGCDRCAAFTTYYADGIHPSMGGNDVFAQVGKFAIDRVRGATIGNPTVLQAISGSAVAYQMTSSDNYLSVQAPRPPGTALASGAVTVSLPAACGKTGEVYTVINGLRTGDGAVTVLPTTIAYFSGASISPDAFAAQNASPSMPGTATPITIPSNGSHSFTAVTFTMTNGGYNNVPYCYWQP